MKEKYNLLMKKAENAERLDLKIQFYEEALELAHENEKYIQSYEAAMELMDALIENGDYDQFVSKFFYCLDLYDQNTDVFYVEAILWKYKQYVEHIDKTPFVTLEEWDELFAEITERFTKEGFSLRPIHQYRAIAYRRRGEHKKAKEAFASFETAERDDLSDCPACEANASIDFYRESNPSEAERLTKEILSGDLTCGCVPHLTYAKLLLQEERTLEAKIHFHEKGYELIKGRKAYVYELSVHLDFLSQHDIHGAYELFNENLMTVEEACDYHGKFHFYVAALNLKKRAKEKNVFLMGFPKDIEEIVHMFANEFDDRNENDYYQKKIPQ
jgi:tetratricopeptide (TPR) repeat protein